MFYDLKIDSQEKFTSQEKLTSTSQERFTSTSQVLLDCNKNNINKNNINKNKDNNLECSTHDAHEEKEVELETQPIPDDKQKEQEELKAKIDEYKDLLMKISMAKEISMIQRNGKGKQAIH